MTDTQTPEEILLSWCDRDLTAAAMAGDLAPAFEVEAIVGELQGLVAAGRSFVLVGDPGVGKTAIVHELVRRSVELARAAGTPPQRFLQLSLKNREAPPNPTASTRGRRAGSPPPQAWRRPEGTPAGTPRARFRPRRYEPPSSWGEAYCGRARTKP